MTYINTFTFNPFGENTYLITSENKDCILFDAGNSNEYENQEIKNYIEKNALTLKRVLLTHTHIDHVLGLKNIKENFNIIAETHINEKPVFDHSEAVAQMYGIPYNAISEINYTIEEGKKIIFNEFEFTPLLCPGHSPGSIVFYEPNKKFMISGDVLFRESIGRTDLPLCNHQDLIDSIQNKLFSLPEEITAYPGHGIPTTIGHEKIYNSFVSPKN